MRAYSSRVMPLDPDSATALLGCRRGATDTEVKKAYRAALLRERPDLGGVDGELTVRLQAARDLLLRIAPRDRRRRARRDQGPPAAYVPMRRAAWGLEDQPHGQVDLRL